MDFTPPNARPKSLAVIFISLCLILVYSNSFHSSWQFDDFQNIINNPKVTISDLSPESLSNAMHAAFRGGRYDSDRPYRPLPMLSFALNYYLGGDQVLGYHIVNLAIHILTALVLFFFIRLIFSTPALKGTSRKTAYNTALLASLCWAIHPIQIQAVTYIVQRMASMAALFYILGMLSFIKARLPGRGGGRLLYALGVPVCFVLSMGCKQNAATFPLAIGMVELIFFVVPVTRGRALAKKLVIIATVSVFILGIAAVLLLQGKGGGLFDTYELRSFTLWERVLTEFRILCMYLYQIVYPSVSQYSIDHEIMLSTDLFHPWTTLTAVGFISFLVAWGIAGIGKRPLVSFALLFFFLNHGIESGIIPLELVFEHRNYLPSFFLFLPIGFIVVKYLQQLVDSGKKTMIFWVGLGLSLFVFMLGMATYTRNFDWQTQKSLWESAMAKAPGNARPYQNLANGYYQKAGYFDEAIDLYEKSIDLKDSKPQFSRLVSYFGLSTTYKLKGDWEKALYYGRLAVDAVPTDAAVKNYIIALVELGRIDDAVQIFEDNFSDMNTAQYLNMKAQLLIKLGRMTQAYKASLAAIHSGGFGGITFSRFAYACMYLKKYEKADAYFNKSLSLFFKRDQISLHLARIENAARAGFSKRKQGYIKALVNKFTGKEIGDFISRLRTEKYPLLKFDSQVLDDIIGMLNQQGKQIKTISASVSETNPA